MGYRSHDFLFEPVYYWKHRLIPENKRSSNNVTSISPLTIAPELVKRHFEPLLILRFLLQKGKYNFGSDQDSIFATRIQVTMSDDRKESVKPLSLHVTPKQDVPVFNLEILVSRCHETGTYRARPANYEFTSSVKSTPRDAIASLVTDVKKEIQTLLSRGETIPWLSPSVSQATGETRMLVPIHF